MSTFDACSKITLEMLVEHKEFLSLLVNGNQSLEAHLVLYTREAALRGYRQAVKDSVELFESIEPEIPTLIFKMEPEDAEGGQEQGDASV